MTLMLSCNPTAYELLWLDTYTVATAFGRELVALRGCFIDAELAQLGPTGYRPLRVRDTLFQPSPPPSRPRDRHRTTARPGGILRTPAVPKDDPRSADFGADPGR